MNVCCFTFEAAHDHADQQDKRKQILQCLNDINKQGNDFQARIFSELFKIASKHRTYSRLVQEIRKRAYRSVPTTGHVRALENL